MTSCALLLKPKSQYSLVSKLLPTLTNYSYCMQKGQRITVRIQSCGVQVAWRQWGAVWSWCQWTQEDGSSHVLLVCTQDSWTSLSAWRGQGGRRLEEEEKVDDHPIILYGLTRPERKIRTSNPNTCMLNTLVSFPGLPRPQWCRNFFFIKHHMGWNYLLLLC